MKKFSRRRPELESLESLLLLSTVSAEAHHVAKVSAQVAAPVTLNLTGSTEAALTRSSVHLVKANANSLAVKVSEKGQLATLGPVTVTEVEKASPDGSLTVTDTVSTARGNLFLEGHAVGTESWSGSNSTLTFDYTITGGTNAYAKASGIGSIIDTTTSTSTPKGHGTDSLSFVAQQLPPSTPYSVDDSYDF